ncbi:MAG: fibrobacter succinogenes major paralogous domain-containing protein [Fibrobacter sp.]|nr:fibrobacter succinogenes major paralogous domain-containing protein [Fibrobacter sp.]
MKGRFSWPAFLICGLILSSGTLTFAEELADASVEGSVLKDTRDGQEYKTVKIGSQIWMAENLSFAAEESFCYTRFNYDCRKYGRFYTWDVAKNVCPAGWHLPTAEEFDQLFVEVGGRDSAAVKLKSAEGWSHYGNGSDEYGFNGTPSGFRDYRGRFDRQTLYAYLWSATEDGASSSDVAQEGAAAPSKKAIGVHMMAGRKDVSVYPYAKNFGLSVRCVKDE